MCYCKLKVACYTGRLRVKTGGGEREREEQGGERGKKSGFMREEE